MFLLALLFVFAIPQAILAEEQTEGILLYTNYHSVINKTRTIRAVVDNPLQCPPNTMGPVCSSDCKTLLTCVSGNLISSSKCADFSSDYPYCVPNTLGCTNEPDLFYETCLPRTDPAVEFTCTRDGLFPSPYNCAEYFFCTPDSVTKYTCPPYYIYDSEANKCQAADVHTVCYTIDCTLTPNKYAVFPGNHVFYAFCSYADGITETIMFMCDHFNTHVFNPAKTICEFKCRAEGWFQHESSLSDFYECYYSEGVLIHRLQTCPPGYFFNPYYNQCI